MKRWRKRIGMAALIVALCLIVAGCGIGEFIGGSSDSEAEVQYGGYNIEKIASYRTQYVGEASKVGSILQQLPVPDEYYKQQYMALQTTQKPYGVAAFYEPNENEESTGLPRPDHGENSKLAEVCEKNALVLFLMIDNVDEVTFAFRDTNSTGKLDESAYDMHLTYHRSDLAGKYDLPELSNNLDALSELLNQEM